MSENQLQIIQNQKQEECDKDIDSDVPEDENDDEGKFDNFEGYNGSGRTVTLQMLLSANVLQPGKSAMTIEYLGQKFVGDLLPDGKIKSQETETIFLSPSAWAMHCKRIINPEKKSGCGWASVKYKGKKLDAYKASWMRKCAQLKDVNQDFDENFADLEKKNEQELPVIKRAIVPHNSISNRNIMHDANTLVETVPFLSINKMQPFLVTISSNALLLAEFHSHLTFQEVCGYFGGTWDVNTHSLIIVKTYPCRNTKYDREKAPERESQIQQQIAKDQLIVVGWYHSHPKFQSQPTLRDCDTQLDYQIKMRGPSDLTYTPCMGLIFAPYYEEDEEFHSPNTAFWVIPPAENRQIMEYGRPMLMHYDIISDCTISDSVKQEMESCVSYYTKFRNELIDFSASYREDITFIEKLRYTLYSKFPQYKNDQEFWNWLSKLLKCTETDNISIAAKNLEIKELKNPIKNNIKVIDHQTDRIDIDLKSTTPELKILSLQEQLCLPSGLNMNPSKLCPPLPTQSITVTNNNVVLSSPSDSPITIPSSSASPAKFEIPVRASPSPAKSDTSSTRTRNSPAPSPGKFNISDMSVRNSPSLTPNKYEHNILGALNIHNTETTNSDLMASSLVASLSGQIPANVLPTDLSVFFQKEYGNSSLKQLAETAAKVGGGNEPITTKELFDKRNSELPYSIMNANTVQKTPVLDHPKSTTKSNQDSHKSLKTPTSNSSYKTKLMKELDDLKNDPLKISELMRSPEYAALLLQQAEALGATTLGTLGFGSDFPFMGSNLKNKNNLSDYTNMLHASKILGYEQFTQQSKTQADFNQLFQQHMGNSVSPSSSKKYQKQTKQADYAALLQTYSKYFDAETMYNQNKSGSNLGSHELSALLHSSISGNINNSKPFESNSEVLNNFLQSEKNLTELNNLLFHQNKNTSDFTSLFASSSNNLTSPTLKNLSGDASTYYPQIKQEKIQEYAAVYQQNHGKLGIPDPLSKSTLAANNMFMPPSTLLKLHQESMMMKPPKTSPGIASKARESHTNITPTSVPSHERLTPIKSFRDTTQIPGPKYNFSAADLAVSSVQNNISQSRSPINCASKTPPVDLSPIYPAEQPRKRMEFSSIADLAAPPPVKITKFNEREGILNLSSNE